jgi:alpha-methylacyl-CoA racemase
MRPLVDRRVVTLAINLPGPLAVAQLCRLGAKVIKVEPPDGDPLAHAARHWYDELHRDIEIIRLNLKEPSNRAQLTNWLDQSDLLVTSSRLSALDRLGLSWSQLHARNPRLCQVAIVGYASPRDDQPGHDLTYQAEHGLVNPPHLPRVLMADWAGAQKAATVALALLLARERGQDAGYAEVRLSETGIEEALQHGLTAPGGVLGGGFAGYNLYPAKEGWIALGALEPHFWQRLQELLELNTAGYEHLRHVFQTRTAAEWQDWAVTHKLPLVAVR